MEGGDADTNACFAGALLGALLGYKALPGHWKHGLTHGKWLMGKAEGLSALLGARDGAYKGSADRENSPDAGRSHWMGY
jgi:hypothetical protein